ncbi:MULTISPECIES: hypothetical protein [unclassified Sutcliffiella]|uniref:hypothetical protein n=1 Tax=unclassified Sutcliffiella TaxID=2837532 RepID=UPI0030CB4FE3
MKKFRGKKRYFNNIWKQVNSVQLDLNNESWFDFYHIHLDWYGVGNESVKIRREHIKAYLALYERLLNQLKECEGPYQTWISLDGEDSGQDAVFVHTPNPNDDNFPHKIDKLNWSCDIPITFSDLIDKEKFNIGHYDSSFGDGHCYVIQSKSQDKNYKSL